MDIEKLGEKMGFISLFVLSSIFLFFILKILKKLPENWNYFYILGLVFFVTFLGIFIKKLLK